MEVDQVRERGDEDGQRHQHRDDGEGEAAQPSRGHPQGNRGAESEHQREERAQRTVEEQRHPHHQDSEERHVARGGGPRLLLEPGAHVGRAHLAHAAGACAHERRVDAAERFVAIARALHVEVGHDGEVAVADEALLAEEGGGRRKLPERLPGRAGSGAAHGVQHRERRDVRDLANLALGGFEALQRGGRPGIVRLEEQQGGGRVREEALERPGGDRVGIALSTTSRSMPPWEGMRAARTAASGTGAAQASAMGRRRETMRERARDCQSIVAS